MRKHAKGPVPASPEAPARDSAEPGEADAAGGWPRWARRLVTALLLFHLAAVVAGAVGFPPSSPLQQAIAERFSKYFDLVDLGYTYRFYVEPPPTPVVTATIHRADGRPDETVRLPGRAVSGPRMRHQRQLALANALAADVQEARQRAGDPRQSRLARAYARHLCRTRPGCQRVTIHLELHLLPDPDEVRRALDSPTGTFDLFGDRMFTTPQWIGDFSCDDF